MNTSRREWLRQSAFALAAAGIAADVFAGKEKKLLPADNMILLNSNENAYGPSPKARKAILDHYLSSNRYPDDLIPVLKKEIAKHWNIRPENILFGAGSSEILGLVSLHVSFTKGNVITAEPSYRVWNEQAEAFGLNFIRIPLNGERKLDLEKMKSSINAATRMVYICNPNNPTGTYIDDAVLRNFVNEVSKSVMVLADEAYTEFAELPSLADIAANNPNVVVAKTFSKIYGLAGARIGYAIAHPDTINKLGRYQPWTDMGISTVTANAALASVGDKAFVDECREKTKQTREMCYECFRQLALEYVPSHTSFILFNISKLKGDFPGQMRARNIFVQYREHFGGKWCRVSMGTTEEMKAFCAALKSISA